MKIIGTSAKLGDGIDAVFEDMLDQMTTEENQEFFKEKERERSETIALQANPKLKKGADDGKKKKKRKCCKG